MSGPVQQSAPAAQRPAAEPRKRIASLDVVRGLMLCVSVSVNSLLLTPAWFDHAEWTGVNGLDLVFPVFVVLTGCGLGFAMHRRTDVRSLARRVLVLVAVGLLYNAVVTATWEWSTWRFTGVLQLYAGVVVVVALGHLLTRTARGWFLVTVLLAAAHTAVLAAYGTTCPGGELTRGCNPSGAVDPAVYGAAHTYWEGAAGHDPEGVVAILGACVSAAAGACIGHLLLAVRARGGGPRRAARPVLAAAAAFTALAWLTATVPGLVAGVDVPAMKRLWTAPFALTVTAAVAVALLAGHLLLDSARTPAALRRAVWPLEALGRNSLLVYFGSHVVMALLVHDVDAEGRTLAQRIAGAVAVGGNEQVGFTVLVLVAWTVLAAVLHHRRIYLRP
ncbi:heparan-alpha-glucosaminide N-acetyltransferase domain-containing protein [Kineococcus sp. SYSU DK018]|uniref:heparan-alpha-glucosaminide N-acetyltransferase domain-containing protein n=1 Tax=Kineococcus sp. SYSU DK018 TaxID=3383139 RepID=UPI003D7D5D07